MFNFRRVIPATKSQMFEYIFITTATTQQALPIFDGNERDSGTSEGVFVPLIPVREAGQPPIAGQNERDTETRGVFVPIVPVPVVDQPPNAGQNGDEFIPIIEILGSSTADPGTATLIYDRSKFSCTNNV